jgi:hypothetical protein
MENKYLLYDGLTPQPSFISAGFTGRILKGFLYGHHQVPRIARP